MIMRKIEIVASGPVDGMGTPHSEGSYVQISVLTVSTQHIFQISKGQAEVLLAEIQGTLRKIS